jgi:exosortase
VIRSSAGIGEARALSPAVTNWLLIAAVTALVLGIAHRSVASMLQLWELSSYQHAWLIPLISIYVLWADRGRIAGVRPSPGLLGAAAFVGSVWVWVVSQLTLIAAGEHLALWLMLNGALAFVFGVDAYRRIMFPFLFLFLALPIGTVLVEPLMEITADMAGWLLHAFGVPAYRSGMFFTLPGGNFEVADVCSGYRYFNAGVTIAVLFAYFMFRSPVLGAFYVAGCAVLVVLINGVRAAVVMAVASGTDMRYLAGEDHITFGWFLFLFGMVGMYFAGAYLADRESARRAA